MSVALPGVSACEPEEATRVPLAVVVDGEAAAASVTTDLGYEVTLERARVVIDTPVFTTGGETHGDRTTRPLLGLAWRALIPEAIAHPGHYAGGEIIGELRGRFVFDWVGDHGSGLGTADLIEGDYEGANFGLGHGESSDGLDADDPLLGASALLEGTVSRDGETRTFSARIVQDEDVAVIGAVFEHTVRDGDDAVLHLALLPAPALASATLYDGVDFFDIEAVDGHIELEPGSPDANRLRRSLQSHDFYAVTVTSTK